MAKSDTIAGNWLTGGLAKAGILNDWNNDRFSILIDAIDEARLRVTETSFEDFLRDVLHCSKSTNHPIIILGRSKSIEDCWLFLFQMNCTAPIFDIQFFSVQKSVDFIVNFLELEAIRSEDTQFGSAFRKHRASYEDLARKYVERISEIDSDSARNFAGYAPVLEAVSIMISKEPNPAASFGSISEKQKPLLRNVIDQILNREQEKISIQLNRVFGKPVGTDLYNKDEQIVRVAHSIFSLTPPRPPTSLPVEHVAEYSQAISEFLPQHPFLDGSGRNPANAVFAGFILATSIFSESSIVREKTEKFLSDGQHSPNPFFQVYFQDNFSRIADPQKTIAPEHISFVYDSIRAGLSNREAAFLSFEADEDELVLNAEVEIIHLDHKDQINSTTILLPTTQAGILRFPTPTGGLLIDAPSIEVVFGSGGSLEILSPAIVNAQKVSFVCSELIIRRSGIDENSITNDVFVEAAKEGLHSLNRVPVVRHGASLAVCWPNSTAFPWATFSSPQYDSDHPLIDVGLRALRRIVIAFRSHKRNQLARTRKKIEHKRMTKGTVGEALRSKLSEDGVIWTEGHLYIMDADRLGAVVGLKYMDAVKKEFSKQTIQYIETILSSLTPPPPTPPGSPTPQAGA